MMARLSLLGLFCSQAMIAEQGSKTIAQMPTAPYFKNTSIGSNPIYGT